MQFGRNPKRPIVNGTGESLYVKHIFRTLQGEGPFVGEPAIFIRLGGCNLACNFCDTEFEGYETITLEKIIAQVLEFSSNIIKLVVITGGEPFRQPIELLCKKLLALNFTVQIETNGTLYRTLPKDVFIVCSPKIILNEYTPIRQDLLEHISAIKFLISKNLSGYDKIADIGQSKYNIPVFVQPMDENDQILNELNTKLAIDLCIQTGARLSLQIHKILGIE